MYLKKKKKKKIIILILINIIYNKFIIIYRESKLTRLLQDSLGG